MLSELGFTEYEARCYVALIQLREGTASDIANVADIPQPRVYDVAQSLHNRGLVDIQQSEPRRYIALSVDSTLDQLHQEYDDYLEQAASLLDTIDKREMQAEGTWGIAEQADIDVRTKALLEDAREEIYLALGWDSNLTTSVVDHLEKVDTDSLDIYIEVADARARDHIHETLPEVPIAISDLTFEECSNWSPGRLLMVDRKSILLTSVTEGLIPGNSTETGLWGQEAGHGMVTWVASLVGDRLDRLSFETV